MEQPLSTFIIYAREDREALEAFKKHLKPLERCGELFVWYDGEILAGAEWDKEIKEKLNSAEIVLLLLSTSFVNSDYIFDTELPHATDRYDKNLCIIIPILITDCYWKVLSRISKFQMLPSNGKPIFSDHGHDANRIMTEVVMSIRKAALEFRESRSLQVQPILEDMDEQIENETSKKDSSLKKNTHPDDILNSFRHASIQLQNWKSDFENLLDSHLERPQTSEIINWIDASLPRDEKGIALLVGDAGAGKSVIMRDVLRELEARKTPVLGIKADQYCVETIEILEKRLHLNESIEAMAKALGQTNERVVVLIDQIDALSQSLSARREYLETFTRLVSLLSEIPAVRIVISCRTYDLQNDHDFSFYRRQKKFQVDRLSVEQVKSVLQRLSTEIPKLSADLLELLRTPLHLDVFCRIYRPDLPFERIKVLRDLYEEFWFQRVVEIKTPAERTVATERISTLIFQLVRTMYDRQNLAVAANLFRAQFPNELTYLKSTGIIHESREGVVFFHQTFYDFVFAKQFVESGIPVEEYLLKNDQNLHIRSCLKMMVEFLRESNPQEYLRVLRTILISPDFYFHIKSLLLSLLGFVKNPTGDEMQLVRDLVFPEPSFCKAFVSAVKSREWLLFLLDEKQPQRLVKSLTEPFGAEVGAVSSNRVDILNGLLLRHLPESRNEVLTFLWDLPEVEGKSWLVERSLLKIDIWDNLMAFKLFDTYSPKIQDVFFADFLEKAAASDLPWALEHLKTAIEKAVETKESSFGEVSFEYELAELIAHFAENYPEPTFDLLLEFQMPRLLSPEYSKKPIAPTAIFSDFPWVSLDFDAPHHHNTGLFSLLIKCVQILAKNQSPRFTDFVSESLESQSATRLLILVEGFRANSTAYVAEIARFFQIFIEKQGFDATETLTWRARQLLKETYPHFSNLQKRHIVQLVAQIESEREKEWATENNKPEWIGVIRLRWLKSLPENDIVQLPEAEKNFRELTLRFQELSDEEPNKIRNYWVGPPMEQDEYENMALEKWKESFSKYDEKHESGWGSHKGGMEQHAQRFKAEVKKRPDFFYPLIEELTTLAGVPKTYLSHGLDGLKEAKCEPERLLSLLKKTDLAGLESWDVRCLVSLCLVFANEKIEDDFVVDFLVKMTLTHFESEDDALQKEFGNDKAESTYISGYNTVRGSAVHLLPYFYYFKKHENLLFETLENVAQDDLPSVRCQMMPRLALLTNLDKARSLRLFLRLIRDNEAAIMEHSPWSAKYFARQDFVSMKPYFEKALAHPKIHKDMAMILSLTWVYDRDDAIELLNQFINISEESKAGAIEVAAHNIRNDNGNPIPRSIELFARFLEESSEGVIQAYDLAFRHLKPGDFPHLQPTLIRFAKTVVARKNPRPFYEYLIACAKSYPEECLELVENFAEYQKPDIGNAGHYDTEPLKVVINAYNELWGRKIKDHAMLRKALLLFDKMLLDDRFRRDAETVLVDVER